MLDYFNRFKTKKYYINNIKQKIIKNSLIYDEPADNWLDGHPLGNGDLGVMIFGSPSSFKFYFNKSDVWDTRTVSNNESIFPGKKYKELLEIVEKGDIKEFNRIGKKYTEDFCSTNYPCPQPCGILEIKFKKSLYDKYIQILNIYNGTDEISWYEKIGKYNLSCYVNQNQNISECNIDFFDKNENELEISLHRKKTDLYEKEKIFLEGNFLGFEFTFPNNFKYVNLLYIYSEYIDITKDYKIKIPSMLSCDIRIIQTIVTTNETDDIKLLAFDRINKYLKEDKIKVKEESDKFWIDFWDRSYINLLSIEAEKNWYMGIYLIGSSSRKGGLMATPLSLWSEDYCPAWKGIYNTDQDVESTYSPLYASGHIDIAEPFYRLYKELIIKFKKDTKYYFEVDGIKLPTIHDSKGNDMSGYMGCVFWQGSSAWIALNFWKNYLYTQDFNFLKDFAYPFISECIKFYNNILRKTTDGKYIVYKSYIPEEMEKDQIKAIDNNTTIDLSLIRSLYKCFIEMIDILGDKVDVNLDISLVKDIYGNLSDYPQKSGYMMYSENCDFNYCHRLISVLFPIYPIGEINAYSSSKEKYHLGLNTFYNYIKKENTSKRMYMCMTYPFLASVAAILGLKDFANLYLSDYMDTFSNNRNLLCMIFDFKKKGRGCIAEDGEDFSAGNEYKFPDRLIGLQTNSLIAESINLMLLQSFGRELSIFPAYPWKNGSFESLRAEGGFLVSSKLENWKICSLFIKSLYGNICNLYLDSAIKDVKIKNLTDKKIVKISKIEKNNIGNKIKFNFKTNPNNEYKIEVGY